MAEGRFTKLEGAGGSTGLTPPPGTIARNAPKKTPPPEDDTNYPTCVLRGDEAFYTGNFRDALRHYSRALQEQNNQIYPWIGQLSALIALKQYKEAELWSNRALDQFPEDSSLLSQRARVLAHTGNLKRAIGVSDFAISKGATSWSWLARGEVLLEANDNNALFCFTKAIESSEKDDWRTPFLAGLAYLNKRRWADAEEFLKKSVAIHSQNFYSWYCLALALAEMSYTDRARDAVQRSMQLKKDYAPARDLELKIFRRPFFKQLFGFLKR
ncbi:tetratricopeptide repeat protein [Candidatus Sumerlaeota bacterium]|nr:tetratricopeptide repeat protein [Candidatus Sumerlaeota bacterium]